MYSSRDKGTMGEEAAVNYLHDMGYIIIERNFSTKYGEIDIIGRDKDYIVFIEVKSRKDFKKGFPCEAVSISKQRRIIRMALVYILKNKLFNNNFRFDVVEVVLGFGGVKHLRLIKDAFQAEITI